MSFTHYGHFGPFSKVVVTASPIAFVALGVMAGIEYGAKVFHHRDDGHPQNASAYPPVPAHCQPAAPAVAAAYNGSALPDTGSQKPIVWTTPTPITLSPAVEGAQPMHDPSLNSPQGGARTYGYDSAPVAGALNFTPGQPAAQPPSEPATVAATQTPSEPVTSAATPSASGIFSTSTSNTGFKPEDLTPQDRLAIAQIMLETMRNNQLKGENGQNLVTTSIDAHHHGVDGLEGRNSRGGDTGAALEEYKRHVGFANNAELDPTTFGRLVQSFQQMEGVKSVSGEVNPTIDATTVEALAREQEKLRRTMTIEHSVEDIQKKFNAVSSQFSGATGSNEEPASVKPSATPGVVREDSSSRTV